MSKLDDKIVQAVLGKPLPEGMPVPGFVEKIKQAFADEGYLPGRIIEDKGEWAKAVVDSGGKVGTFTGVSIVECEPVLTGQEWYDRFEKELGYFDNASGIDGPSFVESPSALKESILASAKRAAGFET